MGDWSVKSISLILVRDCDDICKRVCGLRDFLRGVSGSQICAIDYKLRGVESKSGTFKTFYDRGGVFKIKVLLL